MPATETKTSHYEVKWTDAKGQVQYGVARSDFDKEAKKWAKQGKLVVDHAVLPQAFVLPEAAVTDIPTGYPNEYSEWVDHQSEIAHELSDALAPGVRVNKLFSVGVADGQACYIITKVNGTKCDVEWRGFGGGDRYTDHYFGWGRKGVAVRDVAQYVGRSDGMKQLFKDRDQKKKSFMDGVNVGDIVHYHNGHGSYVRCQIVLADENEVNAKRNARQAQKQVKMLKPIALVGIWSKHDLPHYAIDGEWMKPYHAEQIEKGEAWMPDTGCIYEAPNFTRPGHFPGQDWTTMPGAFANEIDPRKLFPLPLDPPEPTSEQVAQFRAWRLINIASEMLNPSHEKCKRLKEINWNDPVQVKAEADLRMREVQQIVATYFDDPNKKA